MGKGNYVRGMDRLRMLGLDLERITSRRELIHQLVQEGRTFGEIGKQLGIRRQRVHQIYHAKSITREEYERWREQYIAVGHYDI